MKYIYGFFLSILFSGTAFSTETQNTVKLQPTVIEADESSTPTKNFIIGYYTITNNEKTISVDLKNIEDQINLPENKVIEDVLDNYGKREISIVKYEDYKLDQSKSFFFKYIDNNEKSTIYSNFGAFSISNNENKFDVNLVMSVTYTQLPNVYSLMPFDSSYTFNYSKKFNIEPNKYVILDISESDKPFSNNKNEKITRFVIVRLNDIQ